MKKRIVFRGELALCIVIVLNSFGVDLMLYSGSGISAISSVPYIVSEVLTCFTLGTWTYLFQTALVVALMIMRKQITPSYLFSFAVGIAFGKLMDLHQLWILQLPLTMVLRIVYFAISYAAIVIGISLSNHCKLPIIPTDLFPRETSAILKTPYQSVKTIFDVSCLAVTLMISLTYFHCIIGIGLGTLLSAFTMGKMIGLIDAKVDKQFVFVSFMEPPGAARV
ncbi:MAG: hypothetical protein H6Q60_748 [Oscillospiraceae bacterium]|nr:hypothetical protein [Oscillospiraceae bacterium]